VGFKRSVAASAPGATPVFDGGALRYISVLSGRHDRGNVDAAGFIRGLAGRQRNKAVGRPVVSASDISARVDAIVTMAPCA
jgi:hypothetical protein